MLTEAIAKAQNAVGYDEELVAFVDGSMLSALQNSTEISRHLVMNDFKKGELHTQVTSLNGVAILPVPDSRMKTAYDFYDGTTAGQEAGGFTPIATAKSVGLLLCLNSGEERPYDRYVELYLRALTHTGGAPRRRGDVWSGEETV